MPQCMQRSVRCSTAPAAALLAPAHPTSPPAPASWLAAAQHHRPCAMHVNSNACRHWQLGLPPKFSPRRTEPATRSCSSPRAASNTPVIKLPAIYTEPNLSARHTLAFYPLPDNPRAAFNMRCIASVLAAAAMVATSLPAASARCDSAGWVNQGYDRCHTHQVRFSSFDQPVLVCAGSNRLCTRTLTLGTGCCSISGHVPWHALLVPRTRCHSMAIALHARPHPMCAAMPTG